jgi:hypothetical protein
VHHQHLRGSRPWLLALSLSSFVPELHSSATMLIPITSPDDGSEVQEWALVELQGRIEPMQETDLQQELRVGTMQLSKTVRWPSGWCCAAHTTSCSPMLVPFTLDPLYAFQSHVGLSTTSNCCATDCHMCFLLLHRTRTPCSCR